MKYNEIYNLKDLKMYCNKCNRGEICTNTNPQYIDSTTSPIVFGDKYTSPSGALGYRLLDNEIVYDKVLTIRGVIYSYYTPIGLITRDCIMLLDSKQAPFKSVTTKKLLTILNRENWKVSLMQLKTVLIALGIDLGWLE